LGLSSESMRSISWRVIKGSKRLQVSSASLISRVSSRETVVTGSYAGDLFSNSLVQNSWLMESESLELKYIREEYYFKLYSLQK